MKTLINLVLKVAVMTFPDRMIVGVEGFPKVLKEWVNGILQSDGGAVRSTFL